jgi:hypothetical protein
MYRSILRCSAPVSRLHRLQRAANRRRGRTLTAVPLVVELGLGNRVERVERAREVQLPWRERMVFSRRGWQWQPAPPAPKAPAERAGRPGRVRIADVRGYLPRDPRVEHRIGHSTVRYGRVAVGYLDVSDLTEVDTGRRDVRQWVAPDGTTYVYDKGLTPGDPYFFNVYLPPVSGEEVGDE